MIPPSLCRTPADSNNFWVPRRVQDSGTLLHILLLRAFRPAATLILQLRLGYLWVWISPKFSIWGFRYVGIVLSPCNHMISGRQYILHCMQKLSLFVSLGKCLIMSNLPSFVNGSIHQGHERFSDILRRRQCSAFLLNQWQFVHSVGDWRNLHVISNKKIKLGTLSKVMTCQFRGIKLLLLMNKKRVDQRYCVRGSLGHACEKERLY